MRFIAPAVLLAFFASATLPASASLAEEASGGEASYQFDAGTHHDAPDSCDAAGPTWSLPLGGSVEGMLAPPEDPADVYVLDIPASAVGQRISILLQERSGPQADLGVLLPGCVGDVFAPENQPVPPPAPPAPESWEKQVTLENAMGPWDCRADEWVFKINQPEGPWPPTIHVAWTDGSERTLPLRSDDGVRRYSTTEALGYTLTQAWANVPSAWTGHFTVNRGPCDAVDGGAVYGEPPSLMDDLLSFTPVRAGPHVVGVAASPPEGSADSGSLVVPASCHWCVGEVHQVVSEASYRLMATYQRK